jgi:hypothetical protein
MMSISTMFPMKKLNDYIHRAAAAVLTAGVLILGVACQDDKVDEVFDKSSAERSAESIRDVREQLKASEHGWTVSYKPSKEETGYYQFVFKFHADSIVEMASDFSQEDLTLKSSAWDVVRGSTTKLTFSTNSALHRLSDSNFSPIPGATGSGLKGDFEFLYYGTTDGGDMIFRTNRTLDTVIFKKATASSLADLTAAYDNIGRVTEGRSVYRALEEAKGADVTRSAFDFPYDARVISIRSVIETEVDGKTVYSFDDGYTIGYGFTPKGIFVDSIKLSNGRVVKYPEFTYDEDEQRFVSTLSDGTKLSIGDVSGPIVPVDGQKVILDPKLTYNLQFIFGDTDIGILTTPAFEDLYLSAAPLGLTSNFVLWVQLPFNGTPIDYLAFPGTGSVANSTIRQLITFEDKGDRLVMHDNGFRDAASHVKPENQAYYNMLADVLLDPEGFYVENLGKYTRYLNLVFTFTSVKDPSIRFGMYHTAPQ